VNRGIAVCFFAVQALAQPGSAVSSEAGVVRQRASELMERAERSQALFGNRIKALSEVEALARDCAQRDWDGYGAAAIDPRALVGAINFLRAMPDGLPMPEFAGEPDGSISLDWSSSRHCLLSLSVGVSDRIPYAWLDGTDRGHAVVRFDGWRVPERVVEAIELIARNGETTLRTA